MLRHNILCFVRYIFFSHLLIFNIIATKHHIVSVSEYVVLEGCGTSATKKYWKYENNVLFYNKIIMDHRFDETVTVRDDFSLAVTNASLEHEGTYECSHGSVSMMNHTLEVQVPPYVVMSIDGRPIKQEIHYFEAEKEISVVCNASGAKPAVNLTFMKNNAIVGPLEIHYKVSVNRQSNRTFDSVGRFNTQLPEVNGNISCFSSGQNVSEEQKVKLQYHTYSVPVIALTLNGQRTDDVLYVRENDRIWGECTVTEARPSVNITWRIDNKEIDSKSETTTTSASEASKTFNAHSSIRYQPSTANGTISCVATLGNTGIVQAAERSFYTYVIPEFSIMINGRDVDELVYILQGGELVASCHATGTRPDVDLEWMVNNVKLDPNIGLYNLQFNRHDNNMTTNFTSSLRFLPKRANGNITCGMKGHPVGDMYLHATYQINEANTSAIQPTHKLIRSMAIYLVVPTSVFLFSLACFFIKKALQVSGQSHLFRNQEYSPTDSCSADECKLKELQGQRSSLHIERKESLMRTENISETVEYQRPPKLELPELPEEVVDPGYTHVPENENGYCTVLGEKVTESRIFYEKDLCLILSMKMGQMYNRWMGTINVSDDTSKCVVISTVSDAVLKTKSINWNGFVKRVLELPDNVNLTKVEGICIDSAHLYLLHEHLICGTLDIRVKEIQDEDASEVMRYISGILKGMELLHSYGFLHPGLSTKKVLLTKEGICKLYDFCLSENAANVVNNKKTLMNCSVNQLAPEALLRNEYTQAADVWSTAVVIWEIMTGGCLPFSLDGQAMNTERISFAPESWPGKYQQLRNNRLTECWNRDFTLRPTINQLRNSFTKLFENFGTQTLNEDFLQTTLDTYVPMKDSTEIDES